MSSMVLELHIVSFLLILRVSNWYKVKKEYFDVYSPRALATQALPG